MALPNGAGGYQVGDGNRNEPRIGYANAAFRFRKTGDGAWSVYKIA